MKFAILKSEWLIGFRNRRLFFFNTIIPVVFVAPIILSDAPAVHLTAIIVVLFALFSTFGSSIPLVRDQESGLLQRYVMTGVNPGWLLIERTVAFVALDFLQLVPAMFLIIFSSKSNAGIAPLFAVGVLLSLLAGNLVGVLAASIARSIAEGALFSSLFALYMVHLAGVFRVAPPGSLFATLEPWVPFRPLYISVRALVSGINPAENAEVMYPPLLVTLGLILAVYFWGQALFTSKETGS